ncbi:MAG: hypothetical protein JO270_08115 [Acidobacteriaceae bacterium]|nr:hypothetical protein [Acidobacteriaceae bacterium]MBV8572309.1 hypothetical protein [Acidobacteriaceae bacterium]
MPKSFDWRTLAGNGEPRGTRFWLKITLAGLVLLNCIALFLYLDPPGGSRAQLQAQSQSVRMQVAAARGQAHRLETVSNNVQMGSMQSADFEAKYFLERRQAYEAVLAEIQRIAQIAGLQERDAVFSEEPIEGTDDLSLLNMTANYEGTYTALTRFLFESDRSPMLLMLDSMAASPQQKAGLITTSIRFQAIIREPANTPTAGGQQ